MKELLLIRHAKAEKNPQGIIDDMDRPLTKRGSEDARKMGCYLGSIGFEIDQTFCSPALRTRQTFDAMVQGGFSHGHYTESMSIYEEGVAALERLIEDLPARIQRVAIIGHNPTLEDWAQQLCRISYDTIHLKPGAMICLSWPHAQIRWLLSPGLLPE